MHTPGTYGYVDAKEEERYQYQQNALSKLFQDAPDWATHNGGCPCLLDTPSTASPVSTNPLYYFDIYYQRVIDLLNSVAGADGIQGPALIAACGVGGAIPVFHQRLSQKTKLMGLDLLPFCIDVAKRRHGSLAEFIVGDIFKLQDHVPAGSLGLIYSDVTLEDFKHFLGRAVYQMVRALRQGGFLVCPLSPHPVYCPAAQTLKQVTGCQLEVVAQLPMTDSILAALDDSDGHFSKCLDLMQGSQNKPLQDFYLSLTEATRRFIRQKYTHSIVVLRKVGDPVPTSVTGAVPESADAEDLDRYGEEVVTWYEQYETDGRAIPTWVRQLSYPCLPPADMDASPPVGQNAHFYLDAFYHRILALAETVIDLQSFEGPCIFTGCGLGGMVPILRARMPSLQRLVAGDIVPFFLQIAKSRGLDATAELCVLDVLKLDEQFSAGSFQMLIDDAIVSHMRNDGGPNAHLFRPAIQQVHKLLAAGGYFLPNGTLKLQTMQTSEAVIADIEALGFKLLACEDLTADCLKACDLMEEHILGSAKRRGCLNEEDRQQYPELVSDVRDSFTEYYRCSMSQGVKGLGHWIFQKV